MALPIEILRSFAPVDTVNPRVVHLNYYPLWLHQDLTNCAMFFKRYRERRRFRRQAERLINEELRRVGNLLLRSVEALLQLSPRAFEGAIARLYEQLGYEVRQTPATGDSGRDIFATKNGETFIIECKRYARDKRIGRPVLQKLFAAVTEEQAGGGILVTTADFSSTAVEYGRKYNIQLVSGLLLAQMFRVAFPSDADHPLVRTMCTECGEVFETPLGTSEANCPNGHPVSVYITHVTATMTVGWEYALCDDCGREMRIVHRYGQKKWLCNKPSSRVGDGYFRQCGLLYPYPKKDSR